VSVLVQSFLEKSVNEASVLCHFSVHHFSKKG
jgi:hypothetical protein